MVLSEVGTKYEIDSNLIIDIQGEAIFYCDNNCPFIFLD